MRANETKNTKLAHRKLKCILCAVAGPLHIHTVFFFPRYSASSLHLSGCFFGVLYDSNETLSINRAPHVHRIAHTSFTDERGHTQPVRDKQQTKSRKYIESSRASKATNKQINGHSTHGEKPKVQMEQFHTHIGIKKKTLHILSSSSSSSFIDRK